MKKISILEVIIIIYMSLFALVMYDWQQLNPELTLYVFLEDQELIIQCLLKAWCYLCVLLGAFLQGCVILGLLLLVICIVDKCIVTPIYIGWRRNKDCVVNSVEPPTEDEPYA